MEKRERKYAPLQDSLGGFIREISVGLKKILQIQTYIYASIYDQSALRATTELF